MGWMISPKIGLLAFGYYTLQQIVENSVLVPRIMERQVGVSAVVIIVALLIGTELFGFVGALLAVPTAAIVQVMLQEYFARESD
jgi:predicted PurR-regulated permease PerM